ncbi:MAG: aldo/keto reductase [Bauldia sp.]
MSKHFDGESVVVGSAHIPRIGCGTWELRGQACAKIVAAALGIGYRHIDTAQGYDNEAAVGEGIRASGVAREEVFVTTKVRPELISEAQLERSAEESLARLGLDTVDLLLIHWPNPSIPIAESMRALSNAKRRGLTRHIGVSNFTVAKLEEAVGCSPEPIVTNQIEYHPYLDQTKLAGAIRRHHLAITAYCPIALGEVATDPVLTRIAERCGKTPVQVALRWLIQQGDVAAIPRTSKTDRLKENIAVFDFQLTDEEIGQIGRLDHRTSHIINEPHWVARWD